MHRQTMMRLSLSLFLLLGLVGTPAVGATRKKVTKSTPVSAAAKKTGKKQISAAKALRVSGSRSKGRKRFLRAFYNPWKEPTYADSTDGDNVDGEDLVVRRAAVEALGPYNGSVVVADPNTGRILTIVNQKLALKSGFQPCSTVKIVAALAGLSEGVIDRETMFRLYGRTRMNLTEAIAHSNNPYFANVGVKLGFEKVHYYAKLFGLGEKAGLDVDGEQPGFLTSEPPKFGGVGMMTSFGEGITLTPLQLASLLSAIANGGTMYYLQYPRSPEELEAFVPRVKRNLEIGRYIPEIKPGMMAAVDYGTARRANYDPTEPILGKTGTCTDRSTPTHLGWFGSFNDVGKNKLVVVVLLTGGRFVNGPVAAGVAGNVYRALSQQRFFVQARTFSPASLVGTQTCCSQ
jgi:cell division protein FtsI/penicillin-binding protein 2